MMKIKCYGCGVEFEPANSEEEAWEEVEENGWGDIPKDQMCVVCDDCYNEIMGK